MRSLLVNTTLDHVSGDPDTTGVSHCWTNSVTKGTRGEIGFNRSPRGSAWEQKGSVVEINSISPTPPAAESSSDPTGPVGIGAVCFNEA